MRVLKISAFLLWITLPLIGLADDFRGSSWGDSKEAVKDKESGQFVLEQDNTLNFKTSVAGLDMVVVYEFLDGRLVNAGYSSLESHMNKNEFIDEYEKLKELLIKKYGEPKTDDVIWRNDLYKDDRSGWGTAISVGHLIYRATWETERTDVVTALTGDNFKVQHLIGYRSNADKEAVEEKAEQETLDKL